MESGLNTVEMSNFSLPPNVTDLGWRQPLWYHYEQCAEAPYAFLFYFIVKVFNLALGFPANTLVMWRIARCKSEGSTSDVFIFNLAAQDTFFCLMTPIELTNRLYLDHWGIWHLQHFAYGVKDTTPLFLTCIKVFSSLILSSFFIMVFCNISIIWVLRKSVAGKETMNPVKKKAFKMVVILLAIIVFNYLPPVALMPFASTYTFIQMNCQISVSVFSIMDLSSTIDPILYISKTDKMNFCSCLKGTAKKTETNVSV